MHYVLADGTYYYAAMYYVLADNSNLPHPDPSPDPNPHLFWVSHSAVCHRSLSHNPRLPSLQLSFENITLTLTLTYI